jgi:4-hydroxy-3-methylbut-2-enyl diphosphate reductase
MRPAWLERARTVAVTAGASAPPRLVDDVVAAIAARGPIEVVERTVAEETQEFLLPQRLRPAVGGRRRDGGAAKHVESAHDRDSS